MTSDHAAWGLSVNTERHSQYRKWSPGHRVFAGIVADVAYVILLLTLMFIYGVFGGSNWYFSYRQYNPEVRIALRRAMIGESELYRAAQRYFDFHGETAAAEATIRANYLMTSGDVDGAALWHRIIETLEAIQATAPGDGLH